MASSDDEDELVPQSVTNYHFVDEQEEPISFSLLPIQFDDDPTAPSFDSQEVFLHGNTDGGLQKVYKQVTAWKLELRNDHPQVLVLSKDRKWIKLLKPRKSYEDCIRTISITMQFLHFLRRKPDSSEKSVWDHLRKVFSSFDDRPSVDDLRAHYSLMKLFLDRDDKIAKSQLLLMLLKEKPTKKTFGEDLQSDSDIKKSFIVDDDVDEGTGDDDGDESEEESDLFDSVCAICDNGGELLCCEGTCMRSFHATRKAGEDSDCKSLGFSRAQVEAIQNFLCQNCLYKKHQCFACGKLGSSDKSAGAEVFRCANATCGHFYHPKCVADILFPENETEASEYQEKVAAGESFACPVHKCIVCKQGENKQVEEFQFAMCRRCPKSYHKKCLPRKIAFEDIEEENIVQRAWEDLLPNRILIYCLKHRIDEDLGTPIRNHIIFPEVSEKKNVVDVQKNKKVLVKRNKEVSDDLLRERVSMKPIKPLKKLSSSDEARPMLKRGIPDEKERFQKKLKPLKDNALSDSRRVDVSIQLDSTRSPKEKKKVLPPSPTASVGNIFISSFPRIDGETERRMIAFREKSSSSLTLDDILRKRTMPSTHAHSGRHIDKSIQHGRVEGSVEAIKTALQKLEAGCSVEDAKAVCEPDILKQLLKWSNKLKVYLAPFLHGMRYTSFGRHFTKVDKLKEIVEKLQWYVQNGDTIVDFCCGANDFSQLMKERLDAAGKKCSFKNYDVIQPKNDFNFEQRDWMKVQPRELPTGSQLIMGLNPPFGVKAALANKFIDKALTFKPKLIILIVPKETERLDKKNPPYDLIWEDCEKLSGKSFYLPGSVDINDNQMDQWNLKPPPLYLWSRRDWAVKHRAIASKLGHTSREVQEPAPEEKIQLEKAPDSLPADIHPEERSEKKEVAASEETRREGNNKNSNKSNKKYPPEKINKRSPPERNNERSPPEKNNKRSPPQISRSSARKRRKRRARQERLSEQKQAKQELLSEQTKAKQELLSEQTKADDCSDMSISPPPDARGSGEISKNHLSVTETPRETFEIPTERPSSHRSVSDFEATSGGGRTGTVLDEDIDNIAKRYATPPFNRSSGAIGSGDYAIRNSEERFSAYNSSVDAFGRKSFMDGYGRSLDADPRMQQQARSYSMQPQDPLQRSRFSLGGSDSALGHAGSLPTSSFGLSGLASGSSAMQRYAPRLDETNFAPLPGLGSTFDGHGQPRDMLPDRFAPVPPYEFPRPGSSGGWLDD